MSIVSGIHVIFVLPQNIDNESSASAKMWQTFNACKANGLKVSWLKPSAENIEETKKTDVVVFDAFEGAFFSLVLSSKSVRVVSPQCLLHCLNESITIPQTLTKTALRSIALLNCCVVVSNLSKELKIDMKRKIQAMGGLYSQDLVSDTTHLITNSVKSEKFIAAVERGIKVMLASFINTLWEQSENRAIHASNEEFSKLTCPVFYNLTICSTGFTRPESNIPQLVTENGGKFSYKMIPKETDVLICKTTASEKYKFAVKGKVSCVTEDWIYDSITKGYALPNHADYAVRAQTSTPSKQEPAEPNFSMVSAIGRAASHTQSQSVMEVEETFQQSFLKSGFETPQHSLTSKGKKRLSDELMTQLDVKRAKLAGPFLDGCVVYLGGYSGDEVDRLVKIINYSGAIRSDSLNSRVTHAIFHDCQDKEVKQIAMNNELTCVTVTTKWLVDSMNARAPVDVDSYLISSTNQSPASVPGNDSPLSRKGVTLLRSTMKQDEHKRCEAVEMKSGDTSEDQEEIMKLYLNSVQTLGQSGMDAALAAFTLGQNKTEKTNQNKSVADNASPASISITSTIDESNVLMFAQLKFAVVNFAPGEEKDEIVKHIQHLQGTVVGKEYQGVPDYAVVPMGQNNSKISARCVVTYAWLSDCIEQERLITDLEYYHVPFAATNATILANQVIALSGFTRMEKLFWKYAIEDMGGKHQDCLARTTNAEIDTLRTTHLIAAEASGKKYLGALKWGIPVVNKDWLFECAKQSCLVDEYNYLIGDNTEYLTKLRAENETKASSSSARAFSTRSQSTSQYQSMELQKIKKKLEFASPKASQLVNPVLTKLKENIPVKSPTRESKEESMVCSQMTPVSEIIARVRGIQTEDKVTPSSASQLNTSELSGSNVTPVLRKQWAEWLKNFPSPRKSTPLHEIKRKFWENFHTHTTPPQRRQLNFQSNQDEQMKDASIRVPEEETKEQSSQDIALEKLLIEQIGQLENEIKSSTSTPRRKSVLKRAPNEVGAIPEKESQPEFVGWDDNMDIASPRAAKTNTTKMFMISGLDADTRSSYVEKLGKLGASTSHLTNFDPSATHLLCEKLNRNEKFLASLAAGLWIIHVSYLEDSVKAGKLLNEEEYEFGNPNAKLVVTMNKEELQRAAACYYWRDEIRRRGYGAFHDIRAIIVAERKDPMVRVLSAGGAVIVDAKPPFDGNITATHCFLEAKNHNLKQYIPLAEQGILCLTTLYVNGFLNRTMNHVNEYILPSFHKYYDVL